MANATLGGWVLAVDAEIWLPRVALLPCAFSRRNGKHLLQIFAIDEESELCLWNRATKARAPFRQHQVLCPRCLEHYTQVTTVIKYDRPICQNIKVLLTSRATVWDVLAMPGRSWQSGTARLARRQQFTACHGPGIMNLALYTALKIVLMVF